MKETVLMEYIVLNIQYSFMKTHKLGTQTKSNEQPEYGLLRYATKSELNLFQFGLLGRAKYYEEIKNYQF